jgi:hypothetical protein
MITFEIRWINLGVRNTSANFVGIFADLSKNSVHDLIACISKTAGSSEIFVPI